MTIHPDTIPLRVEPDGSVRVGTTRVLLDLVIEAFENGADPERIVRMYTTLDLADVYLVIGYYLRHKQEVQAFLQQREEQAERLRQEIEANQPAPRVTREMLLARKAELEKKRAAAGQ